MALHPPSLTPEQISEAAERLTAARLTMERIDDLGECAPSDPESAHLIAEEHARQLGMKRVGWKVGCTSEEAMKILNSPQPFPGQVFDGTVYESQTLPHEDIHNPLLESEFAFILGRRLAPRDSAYIVDEVCDATASVAPAFELVTSRFTDLPAMPYLSVVADSASNGGVVIGEAVPVAAAPDLRDIEVALTIGDEMVKTGSGSDILGNPWSSLAWLANHLSSRGVALEAGEFVLSGTCTGALPLPMGTTATASFTGLGNVSITRTSP